MRFSAEEDDVWALVPGPQQLSGSVSTSNVQEVAEYQAKQVEVHLRKLKNLEVTHDAKPDHEYWRATLSSLDDKLFMRMTLHSEDEFGGLCIFGDCEQALVHKLWSHLRKRFPAIWLFEPDLCLHCPKSAFTNDIA